VQNTTFDMYRTFYIAKSTYKTKN